MPDAVCEIAPMNVAANILMNPGAAVRQHRGAPRRRDDARPQGLRRHHDHGHGRSSAAPCSRGRRAAGACRRRCCASCRATAPTSPRAARRHAPSCRPRATVPNKPLKLKVSTRNLPTYRDASVILISQLKEIYIDAELQLVETAQWVPKLIRRDYQIGVEPGRQRRRRSRPELSGELRLRLAHLHGLLQQGRRRADRRAVGRARPREAPQDRLGDRQEADQRGGAADALLHVRRHLLAARA